jgi:hypothetical protein
VVVPNETDAEGMPQRSANASRFDLLKPYPIEILS